MVALLLCDGFDKYGPSNSGNYSMISSLAGEWSFGQTPTITGPLSTNGWAVSCGTSASLTGSFAPAVSRIVGSVRFLLPTGNNGTRIFLQNGATVAWSIALIIGSPAITLYTGLVATVITSGGILTGNTAHVLTFDVSIGAAAAYAVYLDGALLFSGTGNTGNGQTSVNTIALSTPSTGAGVFDDLALFNPADPAYNSTVLTSGVVVETSFPSSDNQKQFTSDSNILCPVGMACPPGTYSLLNPTATNDTPGANQLVLIKVTPGGNCTINSISLVPQITGSTAKIRGVVYSDSSGVPSTLLSSGTEITGTALGVVLTLPLTTPQALTGGTSYWIGFITDTAWSTRMYDNTTNLGQRASNTYTSGAPSTAPAMVIFRPTWQVWGNCTGGAADWISENLNPPPNTLYGGYQNYSMVHSSTVSQQDLYGFPALVTPATVVYGSAVKGWISKSDTGLRTVSFNMKSGAVTGTGSAAGQTLGTSFQWQKSIFDTDPNTGAAWTVSNLNAAVSGITVAS